MAIKIIGTTVIDDTRNLTNINTTATGNLTVSGFANVSTSVNANSYSIGTSYTANSTVVNAVSYNAGTRVVANSTAVNATHLEGVAAASYVNTSGNYTLTGNLTFSGNSVFNGANTTVNAVFRVVNATANVIFAAANGNVGISGNVTPAHDLRVEGTTSLAGAVSDITTLAAGNSTISGFVNATGDGRFSGNVGIGTAAATTVALNISKTISLNATAYGILGLYTDSNTAMGAGFGKIGGLFRMVNSNQNKSSDGLTGYNSFYTGLSAAAWNASSSGEDAFASTLTGLEAQAIQYSNGASNSSVTFARGVISAVSTSGSGTIGQAEGVRARVTVANSTITGNITTAFGVYSDIISGNLNSMTTGYLYYGGYGGANTATIATKYGVYVTGESYNYFSGNVGIGNATPAHDLRVTGTTSLAGAVSDITTLAAGNTTITGFLNVSSTGQFGGAVSGITTLAAGNVTVTGFVNATTSGQFGGNLAVTGMATFSNTATQSNTSAAAWFSGSGGTVAFDTYMIKRLTWNDGAGNFGLKSGFYYNGTSSVYVNDGTSSGAAGIVFSSDATDGVVYMNAYPIGTGGTAVTGGSGAYLNTSAFYISSNLYVGTLLVANTTVINATHLGGKTEANFNVNSASYANASITNTFTIGTGTYSVTNGNFGIGNTTPAHKLRVTGTSSLAGAVTDITTLAAGNTTITGFINATSTLAAGNTTITGTLSVSQNTTFSNGINFGSAVGASSTDLSRHVALWGTIYGFGVTGSTLNYTVPAGAAHAFNSAGTEIFRANTTGIYVGTTLIGNATGPYGKAESALNVNNALNLGGTAAASYVQNTDSRTLSGNLNFTGTIITGSATPQATVGTTGQSVIQLHGTGTGYAAASVATVSWQNGTAVSGFMMAKSKSGAIGTYVSSVSGDNLGEIRFSCSNSTSFAVGADISAEAEQTVSGANGSAAILFSTGNTSLGAPTERVRISSNGNVGIGTSAPVHKLQVEGGNLGVNNASIIYNQRPAAGVGTTLVVNTASGVIRESSSSRRFKYDIRDYHKGLEDVKKLKPVLFKYINDDEVQRDVLGFIAEDFDDLGLTEIVQYDANNAPNSLNYNALPSLLTNAIKEQQIMIQDLTERVRLLENQLNK